MSRIHYRLLSALSVTVVLTAWVLLSVSLPGHKAPLVDELRLPGPVLLWQAAVQLKGLLLLYAATTLARVVGGLCLGACLGVMMGLMMSHSPTLTAVLDPLIEALRPCPPVALIPFIILWVGLGTPGQILVVGLACFMVMVVTTMVAVNGVDRRYVRAAESLGGDTWTIYRTVIWPAIVPNLVAGLRVAAATGFGTTIAAEYLGAQGGLGYMIRNARTTLDTESVLLGIILIGAESWLLDLLIRSLGERMTRWQERPFAHLRRLSPSVHQEASR